LEFYLSRFMHKFYPKETYRTRNFKTYCDGLRSNHKILKAEILAHTFCFFKPRFVVSLIDPLSIKFGLKIPPSHSKLPVSLKFSCKI